MRAYCKQLYRGAGVGVLRGRGLRRAQEALKHRGSGSASSAVKQKGKKKERKKQNHKGQSCFIPP